MAINRPGKNQFVRPQDLRPPTPPGGGFPPSSDAPALSPAPENAPTPIDLQLATGLVVVSAETVAYVAPSWLAAGGSVDRYVVEVWETAKPAEIARYAATHDPDKASIGERQSAYVPGLVPNTNYSVRVAAVYQGGAVSPYTATKTIITPQDITPPGDVDSVAVDFTTGTLIVTCLAPPDADVRDVLFTIGTNSGSETIGRAARPGGAVRLEWTFQDNQRLTNNNPDPTVSVSIVARDFAGNISPAVALSAINLAPSNVSATTSQPFTGRDARVVWTPVADRDIAGYRVTIDGVQQPLVQASELLYPFDKNRADHGGGTTAAQLLDMASLSATVVAVDVFGQSSATPTPITATNPPPDAPTSVSIEGGVTTVAVNVIASPPPDFLAFRYRLTRNNITIATVDDPSALWGYRIDELALYQVFVRVVDVFGQTSAEAASAAVVIDALSIKALRANAEYTQVDTAGTLLPDADQARLKDDKNDTFVPYTQMQWNGTEQRRPFLDRVASVTVGFNATVFAAVGTSPDRVTWTYHYTPAADGVTFTQTTTDLNTALAGGAIVPAGVMTRLNLATVTECRYVRLYHYFGGGVVYGLGEFYARRLVESDDIRAEAIRALHIAAGAVTTDKLLIPGTASIDAALRLIAFRVPVSLDANSGIYQGTGSFASPTTGLKLWNDGGIGRLAGYNGGVLQAELATDGKIKAGGGNVVLDNTGQSIVASNGFNWTPPTPNALRMVRADGTVAGQLFGLDIAGINALRALVPRAAGRGAILDLRAEADVGQAAQVIISALTTTTIGGPSTLASAIFVTHTGITLRGDVTAENGLNVGTATGAAVGQIKASGGIFLGTGTPFDKFGNATGNVADGAGTGTTGGSGITWEASSAGYMWAVNNISTASNANGLLAKISGTAGTNRIISGVSGGADRFIVYGNGAGYLHATSWSYGPSNANLKQNIRDLAGEAMKMMAVRPVRFDYKDGRKNNLGFVAEELQQAMPDLVEAQPDGTAAIRTTDMVPLLVALAQQQQALIAELGKRVKDLEDAIVKIKLPLK